MYTPPFYNGPSPCASWLLANMSGIARVGRLTFPALRSVLRMPRSSAKFAVVPRSAMLHTSLPRRFAVERDQGVSLENPAEEEAQKLLESGTQALELGDMEKAKAEYRKSIEVHENASAYYNLGVCQYQERTYICLTCRGLGRCD